jgi:hypothetical protein
VMQYRQEGGVIVRGGRVSGHRSVVAASSFPSGGQAGQTTFEGAPGWCFQIAGSRGTAGCLGSMPMNWIRFQSGMSLSVFGARHRPAHAA